MTVREHYDLHGETISGWDGWTIEAHDNGLTVCSPGTCAQELGYPDESNEDINDLLNNANPDT